MHTDTAVRLNRSGPDPRFAPQSNRVSGTPRKAPVQVNLANRKYLPCLIDGIPYIGRPSKWSGLMRQSQQRLRDGFASLIARVGRQWRREGDRRLQPFGLTEATWLPLVHLARAPAPMRQ